MIYLDNNATTMIDPRVADVLREAFAASYANPASQHSLGRQARSRIDQSLEVIGDCLGTRVDQPGGPRMIVTSGGTESNNLALRGLARGAAIVSRIEHPSVLETAESLATSGRTIHWLDVLSSGLVDLQALDDLLHRHSDEVSLVSIMSGLAGE